QFFTRETSSFGNDAVLAKKYILPPQLQQYVVSYVPAFKPLYFVYLLKDVIADNECKVLCFTNSDLTARRLHEYLQSTGHNGVKLFTKQTVHQTDSGAINSATRADAQLIIASDS